MSDVWKYFEKIGTYPDLKSKCKICDAKLKYLSSTGAMWNHLKLKHPTSIACIKGKGQTFQTRQSQPTIQNFLVPQRPCDEGRQKKLTCLILELFYKDMLPLKFIESPTLKKMLAFMEPSYKVPSKKAVSTLLEKQYGESKKLLQNELLGEDISRISFTTDCWTSLNMDSFITVTAHFINTCTWTMRHVVLATRLMEESHTAVNLREKLENILEEFRISQKSFLCVHDNAANINLALETCDYFEDHIGCAAHTLQLCVNNGLRIDRIQRAIAAAARLVGHFKRSSKAINALKQKQISMNLPEHKLIQSVSTRWNSTYDMCERLVEQRWAVVAVLSDRETTKIGEARILELKDENWTLISDLCEVLKPLKTATETFSGEKDVSVSVVCPVVHALINKHLLEKEDDSGTIKEFKKVVIADIKNRFAYCLNIRDINTVLTATFLDPRHKHLPFISDNNLKDNIYYKLRNRITVISQKKENISPETKKTKTSNFFGDDYGNSGQSNDRNIDEVNLYLSLPIANIDTSALLWWKINSNVLPYLSKIASDHLSVPASSVPSERMFSSAGRLLNKLRCSLSHKRVDQILFLNKNTNNTTSDDNNKDLPGPSTSA